MRRITIPVRPDWQRTVEDLGLFYHTVGGEPYWCEGAAYQFTWREIDTLEAATNTVQELAVAAVEAIIERNWFQRMGIGERARQLVINSWEREPPDLSLYGRFDLAWDGNGAPKLLEYNADTPTSLFEAAVVQWQWFEELKPGDDQFNSIHEKLIARWKELMLKTAVGALHLASMESTEDEGNVRYIGDCAAQAGLKVVAQMHIGEIGWDGTQFVDNTGRRIANLFKLYPWEWLLDDEFGQHVEAMRVIEPAWKMLLSNKAILPILWELNRGHPNLLRADFVPLEGDYVSKPFLSREGSNVRIQTRAGVTETGGNYADQPLIYQEHYRLPSFEGHYPVIGSWIIGEEAAGIGIREDKSPITGDLSRFVPHFIR